jgi:hypothetical protein
MTVASGAPGRWHVDAPCPVGDVGTLLARLQARGDPIVLGVDFPLGLPRAYAALHACARGWKRCPPPARSIRCEAPPA